MPMETLEEAGDVDNRTLALILAALTIFFTVLNFIGEAGTIILNLAIFAAVTVVLSPSRWCNRVATMQCGHEPYKRRQIGGRGSKFSRQLRGFGDTP